MVVTHVPGWKRYLVYRESRWSLDIVRYFSIGMPNFVLAEEEESVRGDLAEEGREGKEWGCGGGDRGAGG